MRAIVLMGKPCSGKSTIGRVLRDLYSYGYISTGDIARRLAKEGVIGNEWQKAGDLAPEDAIREELKNEIRYAKASGADTIVIDGMPRHKDQVLFIETLFSEVFYYFISVPNYAIMERMVKRGREDDALKVAYRRLKNYRKYQKEVNEEIRRRQGTISKMDGQKFSAIQIATMIESKIEGEER
jgi:adenylate kinase family enzyme